MCRNLNHFDQINVIFIVIFFILSFLPFVLKPMAYFQVFGFEEIESPDFGDLKVIWLNLPGAFAMHIIQRNPSTNLPEGPDSATSAVRDPSHLPMGHHICFSVPNFDSFLHSLKVLFLWHCFDYTE